MTSEDNKGVPVSDKTGAIDNTRQQSPGDPIAIIISSVGDDPSLSELAAFRDSTPALKFAARRPRCVWTSR